MDKREIREILASHADRLNSTRGELPAGLSRREQVEGLLELAEELQGILTPVVPNAHYRRRLHGDLILEAQRLQAEPVTNLFQQHRKGILIGAAAVGSVASVAGVVIAFLLRHRHGRATHIATG